MIPEGFFLLSDMSEEKVDAEANRKHVSEEWGLGNEAIRMKKNI